MLHAMDKDAGRMLADPSETVSSGKRSRQEVKEDVRFREVTLTSVSQAVYCRLGISHCFVSDRFRG